MAEERKGSSSNQIGRGNFNWPNSRNYERRSINEGSDIASQPSFARPPRPGQGTGGNGTTNR